MTTHIQPGSCNFPDTDFSSYLTAEDIQILNRHKTCSTYKKGQIVFNEGNSPFGLYFLSHGSIKLWRETIKDKEVIIRLIKCGEIFGYRSLLSNEPYKASATTLEDSIVCFYYKEDFVEVMNRNSTFTKQLLHLVASDMGEMEESIGSMAHKSIRERIAEKLIMLNNEFGINQEGKIIINVLLSRKDMADITGTTTEQISLFLSEFKKEGVILFTEDKKIQILKLEKLIQMSKFNNTD
ncbi:MAG: hypothetical protein A3H98_08380 [Bacteroidetes bacterium RIFCSPLOWO2_02_FULL_36_8]|nr:MAG: hypothetical protein A3H98_08380 [Bacteroidetes bacterium RIFCSPLOWO2_02_FULL_36_8]OFY68850.1 MAG: hypothetical protein A3G23_03425 [Bacteroidetes bacterium RIFCSPLOWO2_12_FULL_37_12]